MNFLFICLLFGTLLSAGTYVASSSDHLDEQDIDSTENLQARFQSPLVKKLLEILTTQSEDKNVAAFLQAVHKFQSMEMSDQSLIQSENERELKEMRVLMAAYQSLPEEARIQMFSFFILPALLFMILYCCCCRKRHH